MPDAKQPAVRESIDAAIGRRVVLSVCLVALLLAAVPGAQTRGSRNDEDAFGNVEYDGQFTFTRIRYGSGGGWGFRGNSSWAHDYPRADRHLPLIVKEITTVDARVDASNVYDLDDPEIFQYPLIYISEPGFWSMTDAEAEGFREYLLKGGFAIFDDFEHEQWRNFEAQMRRVLPEHRPIEIDVTHPIFDSFFAIKKLDIPHPLVRVMPSYLAIFDDNRPTGRMMAMINYNNDLAEYWEWSATGMFSVDLTNDAYKFGVNYVIYAMTH